MICSNCGHPLVNHGDRAIVACDGGVQSLNVYGAFHGTHTAVCHCPGWAPRGGIPPRPETPGNPCDPVPVS